MPSKNDMMIKDRQRFLSFIKKQYDIYGYGRPEDFTDRMHIIREAVLLAPNFSRKAGNRKPTFADDRNEYLNGVEKDVEENKFLIDEYIFDSYVWSAPNVPNHIDGFNMNAYGRNWKSLGIKVEEKSPFVKNS